MAIGFVQSMIINGVSTATKREFRKLYKTGISDPEELFNRIIENPRKDAHLQSLLKSANISQELVEVAVRQTVNHELNLKGVKLA